MPTKRIRLAARAWSCSSLFACACGRGTPEEKATTKAAATGTAGLVGPLTNDTSDDIVSWVDGQVVTRLDSRDRQARPAIDGYLSDTDPARAAEVRLPQRTEPAAGLELVPRLPGRLQRRAVRAVQDDPRSRSKRSGPDAAEDRADLETPVGAADRIRSGCTRGRSITSASGRILATTSTESRGRSANDNRRCRSDSRSRTRETFEPLSCNRDEAPRRPNCG